MSSEAAARIRVVPLAEGKRTDIPGGHWVCELLSGPRNGAVGSMLGYSVWAPGASTKQLVHEVDELAYIIEGEVEVTDDDGEVHVAGPGDILITPKGSTGYWKNLTPVKKVWGIYEEVDASLNAYIGPGGF